MVFPHLAGVLVDRAERTAAGLVIAGRAASATAVCWACGAVASRVHSRYWRTIGDVAAAGLPVRIELMVRRFFCPAPSCRKVTFAEQVPGLTVAYGRRSPLADLALAAIGLAAGGRAGQRLARALGMTADRATVLRLVRALPDPAGAGSPAVLGVDDFALRRGRSYGTVLVDMVTRRPVDVLAGRSAPVLAQWLTAHPGARVICRDRASAYADAAATAAPHAVQVADRWHLWTNLVEATEKCVITHRGCLRDPAAGTAGLAAASLDSKLNRRIQDRYAAVQDLVSAGTTYHAISRQLGLGRNTVKRYARAASVTELLERAARPANLDEFKPYLHQRFAEGHTRPSRLFEEISARGYTGSFPNVRDYVRRLRIWVAAGPGQLLPPSVREVTRWITCHPAALEPSDHDRLHTVLGRCPELSALHDRVREFAVMMTSRHGHQLDPWLTAAQAVDLPGLASFVAGVRHDHAAVTAALTLPWSSGTVEGHVNRIKMLKRQMYGRASIDLLRKRVIHPN